MRFTEHVAHMETINVNKILVGKRETERPLWKAKLGYSYEDTIKADLNEIVVTMRTEFSWLRIGPTIL
jgi:hypothetical protein